MVALNTRFVYVGTYTYRGDSKGIYLYRLDMTTGALIPSGVAAETVNPSFLAAAPQRRYLYAVNETMTFEGQSGGGLSAFAIEPQTGMLTFINSQCTHGGAPCHVSVDQTGHFVYVANYMGGNVAVFPVRGDGGLEPASDVVQHSGSGVNPQRQEGPHAHSINPDPTNRYAFVADLGIDRLMAYRLDLANGKLIPHTTLWLEVAAGAGPRHLAFHPNGKYAYLMTEMGSTIIALAYDAAQGTLTALQTVPALPENFAGHSTGADIHVAPSGKFLYASNRGHDSLVIYAIDPATGWLTYVGHAPTQGQTPRNFAIDPTGTYLFVANQDSDTMVTFTIDPQTGHLTPTGHVTHVPMPVCVLVL
ncbi:MAG TPA: lactonase family protein [Anaerolineae bacterium]|mgnify:CR=1 FL=1|nr:lactonase family protein [Anaerolineae bacterium]HQK13672.1 lactonase family protein [Anaerolineae bacterium]